MKQLLKIVLALIVLAAVALAVFWFARPADVSFDELRAGVPNSQYSHFAEIDGVRLHYQEKGTGTPLVLIHGFTSSTYSWKDVFEPLAKSFHVIAVDLKGGADLFDAPCVQNCDAVTELERFFLIVRDEDRGDLDLFQQTSYFASKPRSYLRVKCSERLVE